MRSFMVGRRRHPRITGPRAVSTFRRDICYRPHAASAGRSPLSIPVNSESHFRWHTRSDGHWPTHRPGNTPDTCEKRWPFVAYLVRCGHRKIAPQKHLFSSAPMLYRGKLVRHCGLGHTHELRARCREFHITSAGYDCAILQNVYLVASAKGSKPMSDHHDRDTLSNVGDSI